MSDSFKPWFAASLSFSLPAVGIGIRKANNMDTCIKRHEVIHRHMWKLNKWHTYGSIEKNDR